MKEIINYINNQDKNNKLYINYNLNLINLKYKSMDYYYINNKLYNHSQSIKEILKYIKIIKDY